MATNTNNRIIYSMQQVGMGPSLANLTPLHGVRSVGMNVSINQTKISELGQLFTYAALEETPEIEATLEKQLDGNTLLWHAATQGSSDGTLAARGIVQNYLGLSIFKESAGEATGTPLAEIYLSKIVPTASSFSIQTDGVATENLTVSGLERTWSDVENGGTSVFAGHFTTGLDKPLVSMQRSGNVLWNTPLPGSPTGTDENGMSTAWMTVLPADIYGITATGDNPPDSNNAGYQLVPVQSIQVSANLGRDALKQLGQNYPYARSLTYPLSVTTEIEVLATKADGLSFTRAGNNNGATDGSNTRFQTFRLVLKDGTRIDTGTRNKLTGTTRQGGDAGGGGGGGGNVTIRYTYETENVYNVSHPADPNPATAAPSTTPTPTPTPSGS